MSASHYKYSNGNKDRKESKDEVNEIRNEFIEKLLEDGDRENRGCSAGGVPFGGWIVTTAAADC